jgi:hypothetical protein
MGWGVGVIILLNDMILCHPWVLLYCHPWLLLLNVVIIYDFKYLTRCQLSHNLLLRCNNSMMLQGRRVWLLLKWSLMEGTKGALQKREKQPYHQSYDSHMSAVSTHPATHTSRLVSRWVSTHPATHTSRLVQPHECRWVSTHTSRLVQPHECRWVSTHTSRLVLTYVYDLNDVVNYTWPIRMKTG